jgi:hypothetical protein
MFEVCSRFGVFAEEPGIRRNRVEVEIRLGADRGQQTVQGP